MLKTLRPVAALAAVICFAILSRVSYAQVQPGDSINPQNASKINGLVSPGTYYAVMHGMHMHIVEHQRVDWPPPFRDATEKYSGQVRLSPDHRSLVGYVAGQPFPLLDPNDAEMAEKVMWNSDMRPIVTDDADLRFFECQVAPFNPGGEQKLETLTEIGHLGVYHEIGRTEVEPMPIDPDFQKSGIWWRAAAYPVIAPADGRGSGGMRYRYWDPDRGDDAWAYLSDSRRIRRVNETILSSSPGLTTWDPDHSSGFDAKPQEYNYKFLGEKDMLGCVHARNSPEQPCPTDGRATACPEDWEMRHVYIVEATPRPEKTSQILQSKTIIYLDSELWFSPYTDSFDRRGELWKTQIYLSTYRDRPVPDAKVAIYPFEREFILAASSIDTQTGVVTTCYLPGPDTPERECWYINMGAVDRDFFTTQAMSKAGH
jgi:Protein of unknown function (DUF1329)